MPQSKKGMYEHIVHPFPPLFDENSRVLILGSLPSGASRAQNFFYGHPRNRFWPLLARLLGEPEPETVAQKRELALKNGIALWDTIYACDIIGASDSSIRNVEPTNLQPILEQSKITHIFCNGQTSGKYFRKYQQKTLGIEAQVLPSTSPANAAWSMERLIEAWQVVLCYPKQEP